MEIGIYEAKTHFAKLIERVEAGERITITRRGKRVVELWPAEGGTPQQLAVAMRRLDALRASRRAAPGHRPVTVSEMLAVRDEGRR